MVSWSYCAYTQRCTISTSWQPDDRVGNNRSTEKEFQSAIEKLKQSLSCLPDPSPNIFLCGDFNLPHVSWPEGVVLPGCSTPERLMLESMLQLQNEYFMNQCITTSTHVDGGVLDLVFSNNSSIIHSYETLHPLRSTSDHFVIEVNTPLLCNIAEEEERPPRLSPFDSLNFYSNDIEWDKLSEELKTRFEAENLSLLSPDAHLQRLMEILIDVAYKYIPTKKTARKGSNSRIPRERRILMRKRRKLMDRYNQSTSEKKKDSIKNKLVKIEILLQKSHTDCRDRKEQLALKAIKTNSKYFFSYAK